MSVDITVLDPRNVSDIFGRHLAHRYVVLQVTVKNDDPKFRFLSFDTESWLITTLTTPGIQLRSAMRQFNRQEV